MYLYPFGGDFLNKKDLLDCFDTCISDFIPFIGIFISFEGSSPELIINPYENFNSKKTYYESAYNDSLSLKNCSNIKITGWACGELSEIMSSYREVLND